MASTGILSTDLETRLAERTLELVNIASESGAERDIAEHVLGVLRDGGVEVRDAGDTCILAGAVKHGDRPFVLLAGHLDTVPAQGNRPGRCTDTHVEGLGSSDMKGGVAVMLELALAQARVAAGAGAPAGAGAGATSLDVGYLMFGREELPSAQSALKPLLARRPGLCSADLAIMLEPTAGTVQAGCLGNLDASWSFSGRAGHSARPWLADNAIDHVVAGVRALHAVRPSRRSVNGLQFTEVVNVTTLRAGIARNVIPGSASANVNFRYAPDVSAEQAERRLRDWCEPHGQIEILGNSPGALPPHENPLLERLLALSESPAEPKQAWTPVAEFTAAGIEAVNFGPGDPALAHAADERIAIDALVRAHNILEVLLCA